MVAISGRCGNFGQLLILDSQIVSVGVLPLGRECQLAWIYGEGASHSAIRAVVGRYRVSFRIAGVSDGKGQDA